MNPQTRAGLHEQHIVGMNPTNRAGLHEQHIVGMNPTNRAGLHAQHIVGMNPTNPGWTTCTTHCRHEPHKPGMDYMHNTL